MITIHMEKKSVWRYIFTTPYLSYKTNSSGKHNFFLSHDRRCDALNSMLFFNKSSGLFSRLNHLSRLTSSFQCLSECVMTTKIGCMWYSFCFQGLSCAPDQESSLLDRQDLRSLPFELKPARTTCASYRHAVGGSGHPTLMFQSLKIEILFEGVLPRQPDKHEIRHQGLHGRKVNHYFILKSTKPLNWPLSYLIEIISKECPGMRLQKCQNPPHCLCSRLSSAWNINQPHTFSEECSETNLTFIWFQTFQIYQSENYQNALNH